MSVNLPRGSIIRNGVLYNGGAGGSFYQTTPVTASSGATSVTITDAHLHSTSLVMPFADDGTTTPMSPPSTITLSEGQAVLTFDALTASTDFTLIILSGSGAGGGGGQTMLNDLTDVNISSVSNGQVLAYNGTTQKWVNIDLPTGVQIDDTTTSATKVWSSNKTNTEISGKVSDNPTFSQASTRANIASGESFSTILGKIMKFFADIKNGAFINTVWTPTVTAITGATSCTITDSAIHTTSLIEPFASVQGMGQPTMTITEGECLLEFSALAQDTSFKLRITN